MSQDRKLLRLIVPAYSEFNIYTAFAKKTTSLGLIAVASAANKLIGWEVEVIDENNCQKRHWPPNTTDGKIDHQELQRHRPATIVGFYGSMSSTIPRIYQVAKIYQEMGAITMVGGYHARSLPQDMLDNHLDIVALDTGEQSIIELMQAHDRYTDDGYLGRSMDFIPYWQAISAIAFIRDYALIKTLAPKNVDQCRLWPLPDFSLLRYAKMKVYPISWMRGCPYNCEFCAVKEKVDFVPAEEFMARVEYLVEKFNAKKFFIVDDHFGGSLDNQKYYNETMKLLKLLQEYQQRVGKRLSFTVQIRLNVAKKKLLLTEMKLAGIDHVCIGYESPIDEELIRMNKGYQSADMINWTRDYHQAGFFVHGMFIFAYPRRRSEIEADEINFVDKQLTIQERASAFRDFIAKSKIDTAQLLLAVPLPGTELRAWLEQENRLFPLDFVSWEEYDGQFPLYDPIEATPQELQEAMGSIMSRFYSFNHLFNVMVSLLFHFPRLVFPATLTLFTFKVSQIKQAFHYWRRRYFRNESIRFGGWFIIKNWVKKYDTSDFRQRIKKAQEFLDHKQSK